MLTGLMAKILITFFSFSLLDGVVSPYIRHALFLEKCDGAFAHTSSRKCSLVALPLQWHLLTYMNVFGINGTAELVGFGHRAEFVLYILMKMLFCCINIIILLLY